MDHDACARGGRHEQPCDGTGLNVIMRVYQLNPEKMKTCKAPKAEKVE